MKETKNVAIYTRVSSIQQANTPDGSLDTQEDILRKYVEVCPSPPETWEVSDVYREEGKSGKNLERPEFKRLINDIKHGLVDVVLVTKIDRITRSLKDFYDLWDLFDTNGVGFISKNEKFDTTIPMGRFGLKMILLFAELEREITGERTREKMQWRAEQGLWNGSRVPGYDLSNDRKGLLLVNPESKKLIKEIFKACIRCGSAGKTRDWLNEKGYRTPEYISKTGKRHGGRIFNKQTVINILSNPVYIGMIRHNDNIYKGRHEAIIPKKTFKTVQSILEKNRETRRNPLLGGDRVYLLKGLLRCGKCGAAMVPSSAHGRGGLKYDYYQCTKKNHVGKIACNQKNLRAETTEKAVFDWIRQLSVNREMLDKIVSKSIETNSEVLKKLASEKVTYRKRINDLTVKRDSYVASIRELGAEGAKIVANELESVQKSLNVVKQEFQEIELEEEQIKTKTLNADVIARTLKDFSQIIDSADPTELFRLLPTVVKKIEITEDTKTGEGVLEVILWEEALEVFDLSAVNNKKEGETVNSCFAQVSRLAPRVGLEPTT
ncbi:recombinase family protein [candidate division KSB1 bacterium]